MIISHKHRFIFIKTQKTAGTSIEMLLSRFCGDGDVITTYPNKMSIARNYQGLFNPISEFSSYVTDFRFLTQSAMGKHRDPCNILKAARSLKDLIRRNRFYPHIPAALIRSRIGKQIWDNYYKFCVERNPWDKTISHYYHKKQSRNNYSFKDYIRGEEFCFNFPLYTNFKQEEAIVDCVLYYENLESELPETLDFLDIPSAKLDAYRSNSREDRRSYREFFSGENEGYVDVIRYRFRKEIDLHDYEF